MDWSSCSFNGVATFACIPLLLANLTWWALYLIGIVALIMVIFSGIKLILSGGDPKKVQSARNTLTYSIVGVFLVFLSFFIVNFIASTAGITCINTNTSISFTSCSQ